jgi:hypothetical protein
MARININDFNDFLEDLSIFDAFWYEYHRARFDVRQEGVKTGFSTYRKFCLVDPLRYLSAAFAWNETSQGHDFWLTIDSLWILRCKSLMDPEVDDEHK